MDSHTSPPRRILIVRSSALGDIVFCTSLLEGLRRAYPHAYIAWLTDPMLGGVLDGDPRLNEVIRLPRDARRSVGGLLAARRLLRGEAKFDWVIDAQGLFRSRLFARMARSRRRIGFESKEPGRFLMHALHAKGGEPWQIAREYRQLARDLTAGPDPGPPRLIPPTAARDRADILMQAARLEPGFVALCAFTTRPQKQWVESYWGELAQRLRAQGLGPFALFGGPDDEQAANRIMADMPPDTVNLVGGTRISDLAALLERARLVIGVDTGLTHIGTAVRAPTLGLWGSTCPYMRGTDGPLKIVYHSLPCAPCGRHPTCCGEYMCMRDLKPERIAEEALKLLEAA